MGLAKDAEPALQELTALQNPDIPAPQSKICQYTDCLNPICVPKASNPSRLRTLPHASCAIPIWKKKGGNLLQLAHTRDDTSQNPTRVSNPPRKEHAWRSAYSRRSKGVTKHGGNIPLKLRKALYNEQSHKSRPAALWGL